MLLLLQPMKTVRGLGCGECGRGFTCFVLCVIKIRSFPNPHSILNQPVMTIFLLLALSRVCAHESGPAPMLHEPTRLLWNFTAGPDAGITPITLTLNGATAYFGIFLYCIAVDVATGKQKWTVSTGFSVLARPQVRVQRHFGKKGLPQVGVLRLNNFDFER